MQDNVQQNQTTNSNGQLDPAVVNLAKAIRQTESGGNFNAKGASGEMGAYQYTPDTWSKEAPQYGINTPLAQATPEQQNAVAYNQIKSWKDSGKDVTQIASMWNAGEGEPNAYTGKFSDGSPSFGTNPKGVKFNVPAYVKSVATAYQTLKNGGQVGADPNNPSSTANPQNQPPQQPSQSLGQRIIGGAEGLANWAFPVAKDLYNDVTGQNTGTNSKTGLQQLGDAGLSALWFVPGLGEVGEAARGADAAVEGGGLLSKALGSNLVKGGALGYGAGVASNLSQGQGLGQAFSPNISNIGGAVTGGIASTILPKVFGKLTSHLSQSGAVQSLEDNVEHTLNATKSGRQWMSTIAGQGQDPAKLIAQSGVAGKINVIDQKLDTTEAQKAIEGGVDDNGVYQPGRIGQLGAARAQALDKMGATVDVDGLRKEALSQIPTLPSSVNINDATNAVNKNFDNFKAKYGQYLTPSQVEEIKESMTGASGVYKRSGQIGDQNVSSLIGGVARKKVEDLADSSGFPGMKEYNAYIKQHYTALQALKKLNGQAVKGGLLGNTLRQHTLGLVGSMVGNAMGGGILGTMGGLLSGELSGRMLSKVLGDTALSNPLRDAILSKIQTEDPDIVQKLMKFNSGGDNRITQSKVAPIYSPKTSRSSGRVSGILTKVAARGGASL